MRIKKIINSQSIILEINTYSNMVDIYIRKKIVARGVVNDQYDLVTVLPDSVQKSHVKLFNRNKFKFITIPKRYTLKLKELLQDDVNKILIKKRMEIENMVLHYREVLNDLEAKLEQCYHKAEFRMSSKQDFNVIKNKFNKHTEVIYEPETTTLYNKEGTIIIKTPKDTMTELKFNRRVDKIRK